MKTLSNIMTRKSGAGWLSLWRERRAVAALEFALIGPMFIVLTFGIVVYGIYFSTWILVTQTASEAARSSLAGMSTTERKSLATATVSRMVTAYAPLVSSNNLTVSFPTPSNPNLFSVQIAYDFTHSSIQSLVGIVPFPTSQPTITVTVSNGGY
jgi:Flp pilus assembly protein TadG